MGKTLKEEMAELSEEKVNKKEFSDFKEKVFNRKKDIIKNGENLMVIYNATDALLRTMDQAQKKNGGVDILMTTDLVLATLVVLELKKVIKIL